MNRLVRGIIAGSMVGAAAAGTMMAVGRRRRMLMEMQSARKLRNRLWRAAGRAWNKTFGLGSAARNGVMAFAKSWIRNRMWGRT